PSRSKRVATVNFGSRWCLPAITTAAAAVAATATAAATTTAVTTATATATRRLGTRFVDVEVATFELIAVERLNGGTRLAVVGHGHKGEPAGSAGVAVSDDRHFLHFAEGRERFAERIFR